MNDEEISRQLGDVLVEPMAEPPPERVAALRARVAQARDDLRSAASSGAAPAPVDGRADPRPTRSRTWLQLAAGLVVGAGLAGLLIGLTDDDEADLLARGEPEFAAALSAGGVSVDVDGSAAPEGRIVVLQSETLPMLPTGEYYELWFVGPSDSPRSPDRVSAGTFHPDDEGQTLVVLHAAVDPSLFPELEITAETADGDPAPSDDVVLRGPLEQS